MRQRFALIITSTAIALVMVVAMLAGTAGRSTSPGPQAINTSIAPLFSTTRRVCSPQESSTLAPATSPVSRPAETITARMCIEPDPTQAMMVAKLTFRVTPRTKARHGCSISVGSRIRESATCAGTLRAFFSPKIGSSLVTASVRHADGSTAVFTFGTLLRET